MIVAGKHTCPWICQILLITCQPHLQDGIFPQHVSDKVSLFGESFGVPQLMDYSSPKHLTRNWVENGGFPQSEQINIYSSIFKMYCFKYLFLHTSLTLFNELFFLFVRAWVYLSTPKLSINFPIIQKKVTFHYQIFFHRIVTNNNFSLFPHNLGISIIFFSFTNF